MAFTESIEKIRSYALTAKTAIYNEDAMTSIELAGVTACKVNQCVDAINEIVKILDQLPSDLGINYDPDNENITI